MVGLFASAFWAHSIASSSLRASVSRGLLLGEIEQQRDRLVELARRAGAVILHEVEHEVVIVGVELDKLLERRTQLGLLIPARVILGEKVARIGRRLRYGADGDRVTIGPRY